MTGKTFNFTIASIEKLPPSEKGKRTYYKDSQLKGLILDVRSAGSNSFYVYKKINGKPERIFIGTFPDLSVENARKKAKILLGQIAAGVNPSDELRKAKSEMTLGGLFEQYMSRYSKLHKKSWIYDEREIPKYLGHWFKRRISKITKAEVQKLHETTYLLSGKYQANRILERTRALYNKAIEWGYDGINPAVGIKKYKEKSRDRFIQPNEMPFIIQAINEETNETARDFLWLLLLTGTRKTNTMMMRWEEINWNTCEWRIPDTKNGDPQIVALSTRATSLLKNRYKSSLSQWVFPQEDDRKKHIVNEKRVWLRVKERATIYAWLENEKIAHWLQPIVNDLPVYYNSGTGYDAILKQAKIDDVYLPPSLLDIRLHDIRRTFGSYQAISGASLQIIGKSLGHKSTQATQIYARLNLDAVRSSIESATDMMFSLK